MHVCTKYAGRTSKRDKDISRTTRLTPQPQRIIQTFSANCGFMSRKWRERLWRQSCVWQQNLWTYTLLRKNISLSNDVLVFISHSPPHNFTLSELHIFSAAFQDHVPSPQISLKYCNVLSVATIFTLNLLHGHNGLYSSNWHLPGSVFAFWPWHVFSSVAKHCKFFILPHTNSL